MAANAAMIQHQTFHMLLQLNMICFLITGKSFNKITIVENKIELLVFIPTVTEMNDEECV